MGLEWEYSRNQRKHYINDGTMYTTKAHIYLWEICPTVAYRGRPNYNLYHKGKLVTHGKTVKELKILVASKTKKGESE